MSINKLFIRRVCAEMSRQKLNQVQLASKSGMDVQKLNRILLGTTSPRLESAEKIAKGLGVSVVSLIETTGSVVHLDLPFIKRAGHE